MELNADEKLWQQDNYFFHIRKNLNSFEIEVRALSRQDMTYYYEKITLTGQIGLINAIYNEFNLQTTQLTFAPNFTINVVGRWTFNLTTNEYNNATAEARLKMLSQMLQYQVLYMQHQMALMRAWSHKIEIPFAGSVTVQAGNWTEVGHYTRVINLPRDFSCLQITLCIPFTGNEAATKRSRVRLLYDNVAICDATMYGQNVWQLVPINLHGMANNVTAGNHTLRVQALVDGGLLHIPHFNGGQVEATVAPQIFATYSIIGFP